MKAIRKLHSPTRIILPLLAAVLAVGFLSFSHRTVESAGTGTIVWQKQWTVSSSPGNINSEDRTTIIPQITSGVATGDYHVIGATRYLFTVNGQELFYENHAYTQVRVREDGTITKATSALTSATGWAHIPPVSDNNGGFYVAGSCFRTGQIQDRGRLMRYTADGAAAWGSLWETPFIQNCNVSPFKGGEISGLVALSSGDAIVLFPLDNGDGTWDLYVQRINQDQSTPWGATPKRFTTLSAASRFDGILLQQGDEVVVAWNKVSTSQFQAHKLNITNGAPDASWATATLGASVTVDHWDARPFASSIDGLAGSMIVVWGKQARKVQLSNGSTATWSAAAALSATFEYPDVQVTTDGNGGLYYVNGNSLYHILGVGGTADPLFPIVYDGAASSNIADLRYEAQDEGVYIVYYRQLVANAGYSVLAQYMKQDRSLWSAPLELCRADVAGVDTDRCANGVVSGGIAGSADISLVNLTGRKATVAWMPKAGSAQQLSLMQIDDTTVPTIPAINNVDPQIGINSVTSNPTTVELNVANLGSAPYNVRMESSQGSIPMTNIIVISSNPPNTTIQGRVNLVGAQIGLWDVVVTRYEDGAEARVDDGFTVQSAPACAGGAPLGAEIIMPTPNSIHYVRTTLLYEVEITCGTNGNNYQIELDYLWGGDPNEPFDDTGVHDAVTIPYFAEYPFSLPDVAGQKRFRVRVTDCGTDGTCAGDPSVEKVGLYLLLDRLALSGYTWLGASTEAFCQGGSNDGLACDINADCPSGICMGSDDAVGWTSFSCSNLNLVCSTVPGYGIELQAPVNGANSRLSNSAWAGETSPTSAGSLGWLLATGSVCTAGDVAQIGRSCAGASECGAGGVCTALTQPPQGVCTTSVRKCASGSNGGNTCTSNANCPGSICPASLLGQPCYTSLDCNVGLGADGICSATDAEGWGNDQAFLYEWEEQPAFRHDGSYFVRYPGQLTGWAQFLGLGYLAGEADKGWVHFRGPEVKSGMCQGGFDNGLGCNNNGECVGKCIGGSKDQQACSSSSDCAGSACQAATCTATLPNTYTNLATGGYHQCTDCSPNLGKCNACTSVQVESEENDPALWKNFSCNSCYNCAQNGSSVDCALCERCDQYGVSYNSQRGELIGNAWAGSQENEGLGWMQFDPGYGGIFVLTSWLATRYGDIFVGGDIESRTSLPAPPGSFNATYVIQANGTISFTSQTGYVQPNYPSNIQLPSAGNQYINVLGRIDFPSMVLATGENSKNHRYGKTVRLDQAMVNDWSANPPILDGTIYYAKGDITINSPIVFRPGASGTQSGAGTIVVDGNLTVNAPVTYDTNQQIGSLVNLPSVAWLVRGDMSISPLLGNAGSDTGANLVGAFLVVGCPDSGGNSCGDLPDGDSVKVGVISTGTSATLELVVNGLMMAKRFNFQRTIVSDRGSEQVVYDGRLIANPPPGLQDLTAILPVIREVTPGL